MPASRRAKPGSTKSNKLTPDNPLPVMEPTDHEDINDGVNSLNASIPSKGDTFNSDKNVIWYEVPKKSTNNAGNYEQNDQNDPYRGVPWMSNHVYTNEDSNFSALVRNYPDNNWKSTNNDERNVDKHKVWPNTSSAADNQSIGMDQSTYTYKSDHMLKNSSKVLGNTALNENVEAVNWMGNNANESCDLIVREALVTRSEENEIFGANTATSIDSCHEPNFELKDTKNFIINTINTDILTTAKNTKNTQINKMYKNENVHKNSINTENNSKATENATMDTTDNNASTDIEYMSVPTEKDISAAEVKIEPEDDDATEMTVEVTLLEGSDNLYEPPTLAENMDYQYGDSTYADAEPGASDRPFKCDMCPKRFARNYNLKMHQKIHSAERDREKIFPCPVCNRMFAQKCHVTVHMAVHTGVRAYQCEICKKSYTQKSTLNVHKQVHSGETFSCNICTKTFVCKANLHAHKKVHSSHQKRKRYRCTYCRKYFSVKEDYDTHLEGHAEQNPYLCEICNKPFSSKSGLCVHMKVHKGERPFQCDTCNKSFKCKIHLDRHLIKHTEKPYRCHVCDRKFRQEGHFNRHLELHNGEDKYQCSICKKCFQQKATLRTHLQVHAGEKSFVCEVCKKNFSCKSALAVHTRIHTGERPYECDVCDMSFMRSDDLSKHTLLHKRLNRSDIEFISMN